MSQNNKNNYIVYKYTSPSGGIYVGQTKNTLEERAGKNGNLYLIKDKVSGKYTQPLFAAAILKYGWDNMKGEVIYENLTSKEADEKEKKLIEKYRQNGHCYNITDGGKKASFSHTKRVKQYTIDAKFIKEWESIHEAEVSLNIKQAQANIIACCKRQKHRAYGYIWRYSDDIQDVRPLRPYRRPICQYTENGEYVATYKNIVTASKETNIHESSIGNVLHGRARLAGGYLWVFLEETDKNLI